MSTEWQDGIWWGLAEVNGALWRDYGRPLPVTIIDLDMVMDWVEYQGDIPDPAANPVLMTSWWYYDWQRWIWPEWLAHRRNWSQQGVLL